MLKIIFISANLYIVLNLGVFIFLLLSPVCIPKAFWHNCHLSNVTMGVCELLKGILHGCFPSRKSYSYVEKNGITGVFQ